MKTTSRVYAVTNAEVDIDKADKFIRQKFNITRANVRWLKVEEDEEKYTAVNALHISLPQSKIPEVLTYLKKKRGIRKIRVYIDYEF